MVNPEPPQSVPILAGRRAGVFTAEQACDEGWTTRQIRRRLAAGRWGYVAGFAMGARPGPRWTALQLAHAADLSVTGAIVSHSTAGRLHGFPIPVQECAEVIAGRRHDSGRNLRVHRVQLDEGDLRELPSGLVVTGPRRTALDLLGRLDPPEALDLWAWVSSRGVLTADDLLEATAVRRWRPGVRALRDLHALVKDGAVSRAELLLHELLREAGVIDWQAGARVSDAAGLIGVADVLFPAARVVIEVDGLRAHTTRDSFDNDRRRQNRLVMAGYTVLRFTWRDLTGRPEAVLKDILRATNAGF
jgi:hypothetical protein